MALILQIETATDVCSVSIAEDGVTTAIEFDSGGRNHANILLPSIDSCIKNLGITLNKLDAVAVSMGPGSFTGLRIGVATAKGICFALDKPLIAVNTMKSMASQFRKHHALDVLICPMIDARRKEVYTALFDQNLNELFDTRAMILSEGSLQEWISEHPIAFLGDGAKKCEAILNPNSNCLFFNDFRSSAEGMNAICMEAYVNKRFEDVALFEPFYLKDFYMPTKIQQKSN